MKYSSVPAERRARTRARASSTDAAVTSADELCGGANKLVIASIFVRVGTGIGGPCGGDGASDDTVAGRVGDNGISSNSASSGRVSGVSSSVVGGLLGISSNSASSGRVSGVSSSVVGGLLGEKRASLVSVASEPGLELFSTSLSTTAK